MRKEMIHDVIEISIATDFKTATIPKQPLRFSETLVVGAEKYGDVPHGCLQHIVDAHTEAAANIRNGGIMVDGRQQPKTIDNQYVGFGSLLHSCLRVADDLSTFQKALDLGQMAFADDMRGYNELPITMLLKIFDKDFLVGRP